MKLWTDVTAFTFATCIFEFQFRKHNFHKFSAEKFLQFEKTHQYLDCRVVFIICDLLDYKFHIERKKSTHVLQKRKKVLFNLFNKKTQPIRTINKLESELIEASLKYYNRGKVSMYNCRQIKCTTSLIFHCDTIFFSFINQLHIRM